MCVHIWRIHFWRLRGSIRRIWNWMFSVIYLNPIHDSTLIRFGSGFFFEVGNFRGCSWLTLKRLQNKEFSTMYVLNAWGNCLLPRLNVPFFFFCYYKRECQTFRNPNIRGENFKKRHNKIINKTRTCLSETKRHVPKKSSPNVLTTKLVLHILYTTTSRILLFFLLPVGCSHST